MSYRVMIVDDEPASGQYIRKLIELKCPECEVMEIAYDGRDALNKLKETQVEILISDVKMPIMNGIELVLKLQESWPEIVTVIISGYQDFEFARGAIQAGVCDYMLKPVDPSAVRQLMDQVERKVDRIKYDRRVKLFSRICSKQAEGVDQSELSYSFPAENYRAALIRVGSLPVQFSSIMGLENCSETKEQIMSYGRDEMERLMLCPTTLFQAGEFREVVKEAEEKLRSPHTFSTVLISQRVIPRSELPVMLQRMYLLLDRMTVIGKKQIAVCDLQLPFEKREMNSIDLSVLEHQVCAGNQEGIERELDRIFQMIREQVLTQRTTEEYVRNVLFFIHKTGKLDEYDHNTVSDIFSGVMEMSEICDNLKQFLRQKMHYAGAQGKIDSGTFQGILTFMKLHMAEDLSIQVICDNFGISQTTLSRMFREKEGTSFGNYLTKLRIERAKELLITDPELFIRDVAEQVGYRDQFYFSRIFRSVTGVPPSEFMAEVK